MRKTLKRPLPLRDLLPEALKMRVQGPPEASEVTSPDEPIAIIQRDWTNIVGPALSKNSQPIRILGSSSPATLLIGVSASVWSNELEFRKKEILEKLPGQIPEQIKEIRYQILTTSSGRI